MSDPRGDDWTLTPACAACEEHKKHLEEVEQALAAAKAALLIMRSERDALIQVLVMTGKIVVA